MKEDKKKFIHSLIISEKFNKFLKNKYGNKKRNIFPKSDINLTPWGKLISKLESVYEEDLLEYQYDFIASRYLQDFKRRFRVPYSIFSKLLVPMSEQYAVFGKNRNSCYDIKYKLLIALQILATGCSADAISFVTGISETSCYRYFNQFCKAFSTGPIYEKFVYYPFFENLSIN